ncbi:hypothetical protein EV127DRAFT_434445 [Xylaria flabelliformis]|nr:hypothetical protein EV127DRAFT_434445 [Xylaria flabelliformis]
MTSPMKFPLFPKLPPELRILVWEISILEYHRDRIVQINEFSKRIVCTRYLACSPHFHATWESRKVATDLYPIRLPVSHMVYTDGFYCIVEDWVDTDSSKYPPQGAIYVSGDYDIFAFTYKLRGGSDIKEHRCTTSPLGGPENFGWRSLPLPLSLCRSIQRIMLFNTIQPRFLKDGCHRTPNCVIKCGAMIYYTQWHMITVFSGVQRILYAVLDGDIADGSAMYLKILRESGRAIIEYLEQEDWLVYFDAEDIRKIREEGESLECVCVTRQR